MKKHYMYSITIETPSKNIIWLGDANKDMRAKIMVQLNDVLVSYFKQEGIDYRIYPSKTLITMTFFADVDDENHMRRYVLKNTDIANFEIKTEEEKKEEVYAIELYACNECGKWPIRRRVNTAKDKCIIEDLKCPVCGGKTHFEKAYPEEDR